MTEELIILPEDERAAKLETVTGWVSRKGNFYGKDERLARWDGSTHKKCGECGELIRRDSWCKPCQAKRNKESFLKLPEKEWDEKTPICMWDGDVYFFSRGELMDWCFDNMYSVSDLDLVICEPNKPRPIEPDYYADEMGEEGEIPEELHDAIESFNEATKDIILSWSPGKYRAVIK